MDDLGYDKASPDSILEYSRKLTYRSLAECVETPLPQNLKSRGDLGSLVEEYFFKYKPNSSSGPDFAEAGVELKTTGVLPSGDGNYKAKERLVLTMINYNDIVKETWRESKFLKKCSLMLLLFYLYQKEVAVFDRKFVLEPLLFSFPREDLVQIERDWEFIRNKVTEGKAHELSEGDTFYLGACRKGSGGPNEKLVSQPNSEIGAKSRAFSLKQSYMTQIISSHAAGMQSLGVTETEDFETATKRLFESHLGITVDELAKRLGLDSGPTRGKGFHRRIAERILRAESSSVSELAKAGIEMKTIRLNSKGNPRESMSFPAFSFTEIGTITWEESKFFERIERKFLLVVFSTGNDGEERLLKVGYWNMPFEDRQEAERVWLLTQKRLADDVLPLPKESESTVAHVRPKARNGADKALLPNGQWLTKQAFWLNKKYIASVVDAL
jgi:DNA mismatch repair protein MutH